MKINVHAGHNPDGKVACGAVGLLKESTEAREVKDRVIKYLRDEKHTAYDCTVNNGTSANDILKKIVSKCNDNEVSLDVSIHLNSGRSDKKGDGKIGGVEVLVYSEDSKAYNTAVRVADKVSKALGITNRGVKVRSNLYVLKNTDAPAMLIECCFVDDKDDVKKWNTDKCARAIAEGILNKSIGTKKTTTAKSNDYKIKVTSNTLNVYAAVDKVRKDEVFTITEEKRIGSSKYGKLKSGAGWILLDNTKKV